jgi:archaellum component FlaC
MGDDTFEKFSRDVFLNELGHIKQDIGELKKEVADLKKEVSDLTIAVEILSQQLKPIKRVVDGMIWVILVAVIGTAMTFILKVRG